MTDSFALEAPDYFTVGTIGPPGQRAFYLQARQARQVVTLKVEKEQVRALGQYLGGLLAKLSPAPEKVPSDLPLLEPVNEAWAVASLGVGYDEDRDRIVIMAKAVIEGDEEQEDEASEDPAETAATDRPTARFAITRAQAGALVERAQALMKGGRPICPMCSAPIDAEGHVCPRANGHVTPHA